MLHRCRVCKKIKRIAPANVRISNWRCNACVHQSRKRRPGHLAGKRAYLRKYYQTPKGRAKRSRYATRPDVREHNKYRMLSARRRQHNEESSAFFRPGGC